MNQGVARSQKENPVKRGLALGTRVAPSVGALGWWKGTLKASGWKFAWLARKGTLVQNPESVI